jgi:hypothetical protein
MADLYRFMMIYAILSFLFGGMTMNHGIGSSLIAFDPAKDLQLGCFRCQSVEGASCQVGLPPLPGNRILKSYGHRRIRRIRRCASIPSGNLT